MIGKEEDSRLQYRRNRIYYILYRSGLHETADMFWETWKIHYKQRRLSYRIVRV